MLKILNSIMPIFLCLFGQPWCMPASFRITTTPAANRRSSGMAKEGRAHAAHHRFRALECALQRLALFGPQPRGVVPEGAAGAD